MSVRLTVGVVIVVALVTISGAVRTHGQSTAGPAEIWKGVYTVQQAESGESTYTTTCARCHNPDLSGGQVGANTAPPLGGDKFLLRWEANNVERLFHTIRDTMPRGTPGIITDDAALGLVAYILKYNGFPAGATPLTPTTDKLSTLVFVPKDGVIAKREASNFTQVEASGCLVEGPNQGWALVKATDPVPARAGAFTAGAATPQFGAQTIRLVSVAPFRSRMQPGRAVLVKGLIRKDPDATLINLTDFAATDSPCVR
jgi:mono/diheme cytochrome c family protein